MPLDVAKLGLDFTKGVVVLWPCSSTYFACYLHHHTHISVQQTSSAAWTILCRMYWESTLAWLGQGICESDVLYHQASTGGNNLQVHMSKFGCGRLCSQGNFLSHESP